MLTDPIEQAPARPALRLVGGTSIATSQIARPARPAHRDPRPAAAGFARGVAEALAHTRPVEQLRDLATFEVVRTIERAANRQPAHRGGPALRPRLRSVHLSAVGDGVVEACAVIDGGTRAKAIAFRLESTGRAWRATVVQLG